MTMCDLCGMHEATTADRDEWYCDECWKLLNYSRPAAAQYMLVQAYMDERRKRIIVTVMLVIVSIGHVLNALGLW